MRYSVARLETAKQQLLKGEKWHRPEKRDSAVDDWTPEDEATLVQIIRDLDVPNNGTPTHQKLNEVIDHVEFSHGRHYVNCNLSALITVNRDDGVVEYKEFTEQWGFKK